MNKFKHTGDRFAFTVFRGRDTLEIKINKFKVQDKN